MRRIIFRKLVSAIYRFKGGFHKNIAVKFRKKK